MYTLHASNAMHCMPVYTHLMLTRRFQILWQLKPRFHLARHVTSRHDTACRACRDVTGQVEFGPYQHKYCSKLYWSMCAPIAVEEWPITRPPRAEAFSRPNARPAQIALWRLISRWLQLLVAIILNVFLVFSAPPKTDRHRHKRCYSGRN